MHESIDVRWILTTYCVFRFCVLKHIVSSISVVFEHRTERAHAPCIYCTHLNIKCHIFVHISLLEVVHLRLPCSACLVRLVRA